MRTLLVILFCIAFALPAQEVVTARRRIVGGGGGGGTILVPAYIQAKGVGASSSLAYPQNIVSGWTLLVYIYDGSGAGNTLTATDSLGTSFSQIATKNLATDGDTTTVLCGIASSGGADTVTFKKGGVTTNMTGVVIMAVANGTCTTDATPTTSDTNAVTTCGNGTQTITTSTANDLILTFCGSQHNATFTSGSGWTRQITGNLVANVTMQVGGASTYTASDTYSVSGENATIMVALKAKVGSSPSSVSQDASCASSIAATTTPNCSLTINASATGVEVFCAVEDNASGAQVTSVTVGSSNAFFLNRTVNSTTGAHATIETWTLANPPTGSQTATCNYGAGVTGEDTAAVAISNLGGTPGFFGYGTTATASPLTDTITSASGRLVYDAAFQPANSGCTNTLTVGGSQTQIYNNCTGFHFRLAGSSLGGSASTTMQWTVGTNLNTTQGLVDAY